MNRKVFTLDELLEIRQSPYVKNATSNSIRFTVDFKEEFWKQYEEAIPPATIIQSMGFDPGVLGMSRINGIVRHIKDQLESEKGSMQFNRFEPLIQAMFISKAFIESQINIDSTL